MAKEAYEAVKASEEKAAQLICAAHSTAENLIKEARRCAQEEIRRQTIRSNEETQLAVNKLEEELLQGEAVFMAELGKNCAEVRKKISEDNKDRIIGRIIDAVKS